MSIKDFNKQTVTNLTFDAATRPVAPTISGYTISGTDDTALDPAGGQTILVNGSGFRPGATITLNNQSVSVVSFVSVDQLSFTSPTLSAGTYTLFVVNPDNGAGILTPGLIYSTFPTWTTSSGSQGSYYETTSINNSFVATSDTAISSYTLASGTLPPGSSLASNGVLTGTAPVDSGSTTYTFTLKATDSELQDSTRSFSLTINTDVVTWSSPSGGASYSLVGNQAMANVTLSASSAAGYAVSYTANALPTGVTLSSGTISGTPTVAETVSTLLTATAATTNRSATRTISWTVSLGDAYWKNVSLLLSGSTPATTFINDASLNDSQLTIVGDTKPNNFNPYSNGYYSTNMNGQVYSALSAAGSSFYLTGDFTMEAWIYPTSFAGGDWGILDTRVNGQTATQWVFAIEATSKKLYLYDGSAKLGTTALATNTWYHLCWVRSGSVLRGFVNGVLEYYNATYGTSAIGQTSTSPYIGTKDYSLGGFGTYGYISNLRVVNGTAVYTTASTTVGTTVFTPSTTPLTAVTNTVLLACQSPRFSDSSNNNFTISPSSSTLVTVSSAHPFPTPTTSSYNTQYSTYFTGHTNDSLSIASAGAPLSLNADFTVEFWIFKTAYSTNGYTQYLNTGSNSQALKSQNTGPIYFYNGTSYSYSGAIVPLTTWTHIAWVRSGITSRIYVNGVSSSTLTSLTSTITWGTGTFRVGSDAASGLGETLIGNISNLRIIKGTAIYDITQATITVPTAKLTAVSGTSLLTCQDATVTDKSSNSLAITSTGSAKPVALSPFTMTTSSTTLTSLGSAYFDGTGDYLNTTPSAAFSMGTGDFTIEAWIYLNGNNSPTRGDTNKTATIIDLGAHGADCAFSIAGSSTTTGTGFELYNQAGGYTPSVVSVTISQYAWHHVAFVRYGNTLTAYLDGVAYSFPTVSGISFGGTNSAKIGGSWGTGNTYYNEFLGYISDMRVVKGTALYTANFTPPTAPLSAVANTQLLTCQYNGGANNNGFVDQSSFNNIITRNGNATQGTFSPYSQTGWSNYFDGSGDSLTVTATAGAIFGTGDFTIECWIYRTSSSGDESIFVQGVSNSSGYGLAVYTQKIRVRTPNIQANQQVGTTTISQGVWYHIALTRSGTTTRLYINGTLELTISSDTSNETATAWNIGHYGANDYVFSGYISNLRVLKGTALYTSAFTPSTTPLSAVSNTVLLMCQDNRLVDNSPNNFAITKAGDVSVQAYSPFGGITSVPTSYSTYFDGTSDTYTINGNAGPIGTEDFTWECWAHISTMGGQYPRILESATAVSGSFQVYLDNGTLTVGGNGTGTITSYSISSLTNQWLHLCVTRTGSALRLFVNGVLRGYSSSGGANFPSSSTWRSATEGGGLIGYLSNMRVVRGSIVSAYATSSTTTGTTIFTPPTAPLTAISGTQFLGMQSATMIDNSTNYFSITASGDVKPRTYNPFGTTTTTSVAYTPSVNGGSMYFDGTGDYLTLSPGITFGTSAYTVECWFYISNFSTAYAILGTSNSNALDLRINNATTFAIDQQNVAQTTFTVPTMIANTWYHVAFVRNASNQATVFLNGVQSSTGFVTMSTNYNALSNYIGLIGSNYFPGYISDLRVFLGTSLYTPNFYPGSAPATPTQTIGTTTYSSNLLLTGTSGGIIDYHGTNDLETVGNTQLASEDPYGGRYYSNYFDGTGDYLDVGTPMSLSGDFTIECWFKPDAVSKTYADLFTSVSANFELGLNTSSLVFWDSGSLVITHQTAVTAGVWHHVALTRSGTTVYLYLDGVRSSSSATKSTTYVPYRIATYATETFPGFISNLRVVSGTVVYSGATISVPTTPLTAISGTQLLTCQSNSFKDNSTNNFTITKNGDTKVKSFNPFQQNTGKSLYFDGNDSLLARSNPTLPLTGDFTVECWIYMTGLNTNNMILGGDNGANSDYLNVTSTSINMAINGGLVYPSWSYTFTTGQWYYITVTRTGTSMNAYINGVAQTAQTYAQQFVQTNVNLYIGRYGYTTNPWYFTGYVKDLRITKGVARYTTTFTPPITPLQNK